MNDDEPARDLADQPVSRLNRRALREQIRRPIFIVTMVAVLVAIVAGVLAWNAGQPSGGIATASHHAGTISPNASGPVDPSAEADPWSSLDPSTPFQRIAGGDNPTTPVLTARGATGPVVPLDTGFRIESVDATPASALAAHLTVEPAFAYSISSEAGDRAAVLTPSEPLQPGAVYRFSLKGTSGELLDSWAFQARQPLRVIGTLPESQATDVPLDTGIEITFDQDGVTDAGAHFSIQPATAGRFEQHERTLAFVPAQPLAPMTIYSVTVSRGVSSGATGEATDTVTRFRFETTATTQPPAQKVGFAFTDQVFESATSERAVFSVWAMTEDEAQPPATMPIEVYRLAGLDAGIAAFRSLRARPDWSRWSHEGLVDTTSLSRLVTATLPLNDYRGTSWVQLPKALAAGWYLVQQSSGNVPSQTVLQVTDVAGYLAVSTSQTIVWANDLKTGRPIVSATATADGTLVGRTDTQGLLAAPTPAGLLPAPTDACDRPCDPVVTLRTADGRAVFLPTGVSQDKLEGYGDAYYWYAANPSYWSILHTDRNRYRQTDTVNLWGVIRQRSDGSVPAAVTVRLTWSSGDPATDRPAVASLTLNPGAAGTFDSSIPLTNLPEGSYTVAVLIGKTVVRTTDIQVGPIAKPAYRLDITTGRRVYVAGDRIKVTVDAKFFEGTPVPGVPLRIDGAVVRNVTTDAGGTAVYRSTAKAEHNQEGPRDVAVQVSPARAEEGEITAASRDIVIFPSRRTVDATARIAGGRVRVAGSVHLVALDRLETQIAGGQAIWDIDPRGAAVRGATVTANFVELIPVRTKTGTEYDFVEKKVVPTYDERIVERPAGTVRVRTSAKGTFTVSIPATLKDHDYNVILTVADADGRLARLTVSANRHPWSGYEARVATLRPTDPAADDAQTFGVGDRIDLTMTDPDTKQVKGDGSRYLFFVAQRGIRSATVQGTPRFLTTFAPWAVPNMEIGAVRFTGSGYVGTVSFGATFRAADRRLQVDLSTAAPRYGPGDLATVNVRTRTASGAPIAATVILRAVDEKLFAIGAATEDDPLADLYAPLDTGIVGGYVSHRTPHSRPGEGGDTTGGGGDDRDDFRDSVLFETVTTNAQGRAAVSFRVSDDLTSWRVNASAITAGLQAGGGSVLVPVGLPFFVDASIAPEYLLADRPSIAVRAFGSAIAPGDAVSIDVASKSLGYDSGPIRAAAFATTVVPLPALKLGIQTVTITATTGSGPTAGTDRLTRAFTVVDTHLTRSRTAYVELPAAGTFSGGPGLTTVVVSDASAGRYLPLLNELAAGGGARLDRGLAADIASSLLASHFASAPADEPGGTFDASRYQTPDGGLALLPYASSDLELSTLVAITAPDSVDRANLDTYLRNIRSSDAETRERKMFALAGQAGLGDPVLPAIQAAATDRSLTVREQLMIGLGAGALGDTTTARSIETGLIAKFGEQLGEQARLRVGVSATDITTATALVAMLSAALGDNRAPLFWAYVDANPVADHIFVLQAAAYVSRVLERLPAKPASFAYTVDGTRRTVDLGSGQSFELTLTAPQIGTLSIEKIAGSVGVATSWREPVRAASLVADRDVTISRSVRPSTTVASADLVVVDLTVKFGPQATAGCHQVTELVPSGLAPVGSLATWVDPDSEDAAPADVVLPYDQSGPRVFFCAEPGSTRTIVLRYYARVVTPGTYAWEPAIVESRSQDGLASVTEAGQIVIR